MKSPITSSERRGLLVVAILSLVITGGGVGLSMCSKKLQPEITPAEVEILIHGDSLEATDAVKDKAEKPGRRRKSKSDTLRPKSSRKSSPKKTYSRRNPLHEPV